MLVARLQAKLAVLLTVLALVACGSVEEALVERGFSPVYAAGYADGCASGNEAGGRLFGEARKDANRYTTDEQYAQGWDDGFASCKSKAEAMVRDARLRNPSRDK